MRRNRRATDQDGIGFGLPVPGTLLVCARVYVAAYLFILTAPTQVVCLAELPGESVPQEPPDSSYKAEHFGPRGFFQSWQLNVY